MMMTEETTETTETETAITLTANASDLARCIGNAQVAAETDKARPVLAGVRIEHTPDDGVIAVATDSYLLIVATIPDAVMPLGAMFLPNDVCSYVVKLGRKYAKSEITITADANTYLPTITVDGPDGAGSKFRADGYGEYPNWRQVMPRRDHQLGIDVPIGLDLAKLARLAKLVPTSGKRSRDARVLLAFSFNGPHKPATFELNGGDSDLYGVFMPCEIDN